MSKVVEAAYEWKEGTRFARHDATVIGRELEAIRERRGDLTPAIIVEAARSKRSPLHEIIHGMSDDEAARMGRLEIARTLVRAIVCRVIRPEGAGESIDVRAFVSVPAPETKAGRHYLSTTAAMQSDAGRGVILGQARVELRSFQRKYAALREMAGVMRAIEEALG